MRYLKSHGLEKSSWKLAVFVSSVVFIWAAKVTLSWRPFLLQHPSLSLKVFYCLFFNLAASARVRRHVYITRWFALLVRFADGRKIRANILQEKIIIPSTSCTFAPVLWKLSISRALKLSTSVRRWFSRPPPSLPSFSSGDDNGSDA